jgi:hypothetical protein
VRPTAQGAAGRRGAGRGGDGGAIE